MRGQVEAAVWRRRLLPHAKLGCMATAEGPEM
jgi:hypothetical protein